MKSILAFVLFSVSVSSAFASGPLVRNLLSCTTVKDAWSGKRSLNVVVSEIARPKAFTMTVNFVPAWPQNPNPFPNPFPGPGFPSNPGAGNQRGSFQGGFEPSQPSPGGTNPFPPFPGTPQPQLISNEAVRVQTSGTGKETAFIGQTFALRINLFQGPQGYPALLIEQRTRTQTQLYCQVLN